MISTTHIYTWSGEALCGAYADVGADLVEADDLGTTCQKCNERKPMYDLADCDLGDEEPRSELLGPCRDCAAPTAIMTGSYWQCSICYVKEYPQCSHTSR